MCGYRFRKDDTDISDAKVIFSDEPYPVRVGFFDALKPLSKKLKRRKPVVDHIVPLTSFGLCELKNYQLLCDQCNNGKMDYLSYTEPRFASGFRDRNLLTDLSIGECSLFFAVLDRDQECARCNRSSARTELTVFPIDDNKCVTFDTLRTICYDCDNYGRRWLKHGVRTDE
jgi:5-methylcytosine-specific restriction endonuclease McrA